MLGKMLRLGVVHNQLRNAIVLLFFPTCQTDCDICYIMDNNQWYHRRTLVTWSCGTCRMTSWDAYNQFAVNKSWKQCQRCQVHEQKWKERKMWWLSIFLGVSHWYSYSSWIAWLHDLNFTCIFPFSNSSLRVSRFLLRTARESHGKYVKDAKARLTRFPSVADAGKQYQSRWSHGSTLASLNWKLGPLKDHLI